MEQNLYIHNTRNCKLFIGIYTNTINVPVHLTICGKRNASNIWSYEFFVHCTMRKSNVIRVVSLVNDRVTQVLNACKKNRKRTYTLVFLAFSLIYYFTISVNITSQMAWLREWVYCSVNMLMRAFLKNGHDNI